MKIAFIRLRSLGDTVLMTPLLEVAKRKPPVQTAVVVEAPYGEILDGNRYLDRLLTINEPGNWRSRLALLRQLRSFGPDLAIDLHGGTTAALLTRFSGADRRAGYSSSRSSWAYNEPVGNPKQIWQKDVLHTVEHQLAVLKALRFPVEPVPNPQVCWGRNDVAQAQQLLKEAGIAEAFILIHLGAAFDTKRWEVGRFSELAERLAERGNRVVATAGPNQRGLLRQLTDRTSAAVTLDPLPLRMFAALASQSRLYVGNDTGPTHIAAALGVPVVAIFGSSDSHAWRPWGTSYRLIQQDLSCIPCPGYYCLHYDEPKCIRSVEVDEVFEACRELLCQDVKERAFRIS